jgi:SulP family sulfate permease
MSERSQPEQTNQPAFLLRNRAGIVATALPPLIAIARDGIKDATAGLVASVVLIANIVSFGALMFPGALSSGIQPVIWSMLIGGCLGGVWIALSTSLPPLATGIDSPTGAVLVLLSASAASTTLASGGSPQIAVQTVMLMFIVATFATGALLYVLGALRWGSYFRFVPYFVVGGFLAATGWFLILGAVGMTAHGVRDFGTLLSTWTSAQSARLISAIAVLLLLLALRRWVKSPFAVPVALLATWLAATIALAAFGLSDPEHDWYFPSLGNLRGWSPVELARATQLNWSIMAGFVPGMVAVPAVALISLITKVSSIEVLRQTSGDLNRELRGHGIASLVAAPFGGMTSSLQVSTSRLLEHAGGATRMSGVACALALGAVGMANFNLPGLVPIPIVAGLVLYLGCSFLIDAFWRPYSERAWLDLLLATGIMVVCIQYGYLIGVLIGLIAACLLFAISYARLGVVRRHATRAKFASHVDRSLEASEHLRAAGDGIQIYWLSGYIFFGSSEGIFERIESDIEALPRGRVVYIVIDFARVSGADASALISLTKLRNFCDQRRTTLVYCSLSPTNYAALKRGGFFGGKKQHQAFENLNLGLAWCEDQLLAKANLDTGTSLTDFAPWLARQLGTHVKPGDLLTYFDRKDVEASQILYREGEPADTLDLLAAGHLVVEIAIGNDKCLCVRRLMVHTVVGEMGFFRHSKRAASVSSDGAAILFSLTRTNFERMRRERPDLAGAFTDFIMRVLADRIDAANREIAALET